MTAESTDQDSPTSLSANAIFEEIGEDYSYESSYELPANGGYFALFSRSGCNKFLHAFDSYLLLTQNKANATVFYISNNTSSTFLYNYNSVDYYLGQSKGVLSIGTDASGRTWTIEDQKTNQNGYYIKNKNGDNNDRFTYTDGSSVYFPKDNFVNYYRSWAFIPVFLFETTVPTVTGGTETWAPAVNKVIPTTSDDFDGGSTTASFAATPASGYTFKGWWDNASFTGDAVLTNASYTNQTVTNTNPAIIYALYAKFVPNFYFSANAIKNREDGGTVTAKIESGEAAASVTYDFEATNVEQTSKTVSVTYKAVSTGGFNFAGWYDNAECTGDFLAMDSTYTTNITDDNVGSTTRVNKTVYAKFVTEKVPVFTWNNSSVIVGRNYPAVFSSTNENNPYTIESDDETVAKVIDGTLYAYKEGTATFTVTQAAGNDWIEHTETFVVTVNPVPDWGWISEEPANGDFYIRAKNSSSYINNNNAIGDINTIWKLTQTDGTWVIADKSDASKFLEVLCKTTRSSTLTLKASDMAVFSDGSSNTWQTDPMYTRTSLRINGSSNNGYAIYASNMRFGGLSSQNTDVYSSYDETSLVASLSNVSPWEFISKAQYDARVAYQNAATFAAIADNHLSASLRSELNEVMDANDDESTNYTSKAFTACKTNLDAIVAKCSTYVANLQEAITLHQDNSDNGYYMFYNATSDARLGDDVQAYTAAWRGESIVLTAVPNQVIPAGDVALVYSNSKSEFYYALETATAASISENAFKHHTSDYESDENHVDYILTAQKEGDVVISYAFCKFVGDDHSLLRDRNVLVWQRSGAAAPTIINIETEENIATALVPVYEAPATTEQKANGKKILIEGRLYIQQGDNLYDALGRKVQ